MTANEMAMSVWPAAARARADRPNTAISTKSLPVSVSHDADFGATRFHQTKMAAPGAKAPMTIPSAIVSPVWMPQYMRAKSAHSSRSNRTVEFSAIQAVIEVCDREYPLRTDTIAAYTSTKTRFSGLAAIILAETSHAHVGVD